MTNHTLGALLAAQADQLGEKVFAWWNERSYSYREMNQRANQAAHGLLHMGIKKGQNVSIFMHNCIEYLDLWFGLAKIGSVEAPINPAYKGWQLQYMLNDAESAVLFTDGQYLERLAAIKDQVPKLKSVVLFSTTAVDPEALAQVASRFQVVYWTDVIGSMPTTAPTCETVEPWDPMAILHTSGTTGPSKGVVLCHHHEHVIAVNMIENMQITDQDVYYNFFPLFHNTAQGIITIAVLISGSSMLLTERFSASRFWSDVKQYGCTVFYCMGPILAILSENAQKGEQVGHHPLRLGWGIGFSKEQAEEFTATFNIPLQSGFGSTEMNMVCFTPPDDRRPGTAGKPHRDFEVGIVDANDQPVPLGQVGEIVVRPRHPYTTFLGYYNRPQETVKAWRNLWYHTGDAGRFDEDGFLHFVDRMKDVIRRRGENISSYEVESVVGSHPAVLECAAIAVPSGLAIHDDELLVAVVLRPNAAFDPVDLIQHCEKQLAYFAVPRYIRPMDQLPKTPTEKVQKAKIREQGITPDVWDRVQAGVEVKRH